MSSGENPYPPLSLLAAVGRPDLSFLLASPTTPYSCYMRRKRRVIDNFNIRLRRVVQQGDVSLCVVKSTPSEVTVRECRMTA